MNETNPTKTHRNQREKLLNLIEQLMAVEFLEYHDSNWLMPNTAARTKDKLDTFAAIVHILKTYELDTEFKEIP